MSALEYRRPYVGAGRDGCLRSAAIDREEAELCAANQLAARDRLIASADAWEQQAADIAYRQPAGHAEFVAAVERYDRETGERLRGQGDYGPFRSERNHQLAAALEGLDLEPPEWSLMAWFLSWDSQDTLASIITKARTQGQAS